MLEASIKKKIPPKNTPHPGKKKNKFKIPATVKSQTNKKTNKKCHVQKGPFGREEGESFLAVDLKYIFEFCPSCFTE